MPTVGVLYFGLFNPFHYSPLPLYLPHPIFQVFNTHPYILYLHMVCDITDALSFSFPFPLSLSSIEQFHCYKHVLHLSLYMIMLVFVYMFIFGSIFHI
jgi:hypothetical protein